MTLFSVRKNLGRVFLAVAFTFAITFSAFAQEFTGKVPTVSGSNAPALITQMTSRNLNGAEANSPNASGLFRLDDNVVRNIRTATDLGPAAADMKMSMQLVLRRSVAQEQALQLLNKQTQDPQNKLYGKTLTPEEFAQTFGLAGSDLETIKSWLQENGFTLGNVDNGRLSIDFEGTVAQVNAALHTEIHSYSDASGVSHYANATAPQIPAEMQAVIGSISGLQNFTVFAYKGFGGPVTDFAEGTVAEQTATGNAPKNAPAVVLDGEGLHDASFTASTLSAQFGGSSQLNVRLGGNNHPATGSLLITDQNGKDVAYVADLTACEPYNNGYGRSCNFTFKPTIAGTYFLTATYSGDKNERAIQQIIISHATGSQVTYSTLYTAPLEFTHTAGFGATPGGAITAVLSWTATGTPPTGTISFFETTDNRSAGTATLPVSPATTSSGTSTPYAGTSSYSCTTNTANQITTCTVTDSELYYNEPFPYILTNDLEMSYPGDSNYASSIETFPVYVGYGKSGTAAPIANVGTIASTTTLTAATYGSTQAESAAITVGYSAAEPGFPIFGNSLYSFLEAIGSGALGSMGNYTTNTLCAPTSGTCSATLPFTVPAVVTPGSYTVYYAYSGNLYWDTGNTYYGLYGPSNSTTYALTVNKQTPTFSNMTFSPSSVVQGESQALIISNILNWTGVGAAPTGAVTYVLNGVSYTATCTIGSLQLNCSATVPAATIAALATGSYAVTAAYTTDLNYAAVAAATGGTFVVGNIGSGLTATPNSQVYGSGSTANTGTAVSLVDVISITTGNPAPTGTVTFTNSGGVTAIGSVAITACPTSTSGTITNYTCTYSWTPPAGASGDNAGTYTVTANLPANGSYAAQSATATVTISKDSTSTTISANPNYVNATNTNTVFTTVTTWNTPGNGLNPTGTVSITCGAGSPTACSVLPTPMNVSSCTISATAKTITCTFPSYDFFSNAVLDYGIYNMTATYSGDVNYATSTGVTPVTVTRGTASTTAISVTSGSPVTYGSGTSVVFSVVVTGVNGDGAPSGILTLSNPTLGTMATVTMPGTCTATNSYTYTCSVSYAVPAATPVASYTVTASYGGCGNLCYYNGSSGTTSFSVAKAATTAAMTSPTSGSPVTQTKGSLTAFTVTGTLSWAGAGTDPTASDVTFSSTAAGTFGAVNCTSVTSPYTCSALFTPTGTDVVGSYNINMTFAGDGNYTTSSSTQVGNYVIAPPPDIIFSSVTHNMGSVTIGNSTRYTVAVTNTTGAAIPFTAIVLNTSASPNPFATQNNCGTSIPTGGCEIAFEYSPVAGDSGTQTATWSVTGTAGGTTFGPSNGGTLTGTVAPSGNVTITTAGHNFGDVTVGTTSPTYGTVITNSTNESVTLTLGSVSSPFASVTNCPTTLGAGVSCNLQFTFSPTTTGLVQQMYSISVNGGAIPLLVDGNPTSGVTLTGTGD